MHTMVAKLGVPNSRKAIAFYHSTLGGTIRELVLDEKTNVCLRATLQINQQCALHFYDDPAAEIGEGTSLSIDMADSDEARLLYRTLADSGVAIQPLRRNDKRRLSGTLKDRFGILWELNGERTADLIFR